MPKIIYLDEHYYLKKSHQCERSGVIWAIFSRTFKYLFEKLANRVNIKFGMKIQTIHLFISSGRTLIKPSQQSEPVRQPCQLRFDPRPHDQRFDWKPFRFSPSKFLRCVRHAVNGWNGGTESCGFGFLTLCAHSGHDVYPTLGAVRAAHCRYLSRLFIEKTRQTGN